MATIITLYLDLSLEIPTSISIMMVQPETPDIIINKKTVTKSTIAEITTTLKEYVDSNACDTKDCTHTKFMTHSPNVGNALTRAVTHVGDSGTIILLSSFEVFPPPQEINV